MGIKIRSYVSCCMLFISLAGIADTTRLQNKSLSTQIFESETENVDGVDLNVNIGDSQFAKLNTAAAKVGIGSSTFTLVNASVGAFYEGYDVIAENTTIFVFNNPFQDVASKRYFEMGVQAVRIEVKGYNLSAKFPLLFVVKQQTSILSWKLPLTLQDSHEYHHTNRSLCSTQTDFSAPTMILVEVSTLSEHAVKFNLHTRLVYLDLMDNETQSVEVTPSAPSYFFYSFPNDTDQVTVKVTSANSICLLFSIQHVKCPVYDLVENEQYVRGMYQTVTKQGAITVQRDYFEGAAFLVVLAGMSSDVECQKANQHFRSGVQKSSLKERKKLVNVIILPTIAESQYYIAIFAAFAWILLIYFISFLIGLVYHVKRNSQPQTSLLEVEVDLHTPCIRHTDDRPNYGATRQRQVPHRNSEVLQEEEEDEHNAQVDAELTSPDSSKRNATEVEEEDIMSDDTSMDENEVDLLQDIEEEKDVFRTKTFLYVCDLARKPSQMMAKKYKLYHWNLIPIAIFYGLPVAQLVVTYQSVLHMTGNEDICYYNFLCAHPLGPLNAFNNIFSNVGYVCLGLLFLALVYRRDVMHHNLTREYPRLTKYFGIPQHFGLFYAMGSALVMEGILSSCYHVCPSFSNFQFDTSFMYVISALLMLRIYQARHPDINAHAHTAYIAVAFIIFISVIGVVYSSLYFWIIFAVIHVASCLLLSTQIYYMGRWKLNFGIIKRIYLVVKVDGLHSTKPVYVDRMCLLVFGNLVNWALAIYGLWKQPMNFASFVLAIFVFNLLLYFAFYIIMKIRSGERIFPAPIAYIFLATVFCVTAFYFFTAGLTSWEVSPAKSREGNQECILLDFYDHHDIWHFLSSISVFFSFMALLTLDDDLISVPRDKIPVF